MGICKIYTLNVNGFRQDEISKLKRLINSIKISDNDIFILQEIPHKKLDSGTKPWTWHTLDKFNSFQKQFYDYEVIFPIHLINSNQCTVAICTKSSKWKTMTTQNEKIRYNAKYEFGNKLIEIQFDNECQISLLGLHMNPCEEMWNLLLSSEKGNRHTFIVGDFNAYEHRGEMCKKPSLLRDIDFLPLISSNIITYYEGNSSVDNIYISKEFKLQKDVVVKVEDISKIFRTDHALCSVEFDL